MKGRGFCDATDIINNYTEELNSSHKIVSRNASNTFTVATRSVYLQKGIISKEM